MTVSKRLVLPVVSLASEYLAMGYLMRRNILAYKAPPHNEGYDLVCIHPNPRKVTKQVRVQVKSRYATDASYQFLLNERSKGAFDYLIAVFLNIGYYFTRGVRPRSGIDAPELFVLPAHFVWEHLYKKSSWQKVMLDGFDLDEYMGESGIELIARDLGVPYPSRRGLVSNASGA